MYDKKEHKQTHLKQIGNVQLVLRIRIVVGTFTACIKRLFAPIFFLCQTLGIIRISTQASTTFKSKSPVSEPVRIVNTISTIIWSGYLNTVNLFSEVV